MSAESHPLPLGMDEDEAHYRAEGNAWEEAEADLREAKGQINHLLKDASPELQGAWAKYLSAQGVLRSRRIIKGGVE